MKNFHLFILALLTSVFVFLGCSSDNSPSDNTNSNVASCEGCHTNKVKLKEVYSPDTVVTEGHGCSGDTPYYEPYDRVYMGGTGYESFKKSSHYKVGCTGCHNGTDGTSDKAVAHSGSFVAHPSSIKEEKCKSCHNEIVTNFTGSIHEQGWGQKRKVAIRSGLAGAAEFDKLPAHQVDGYNHNCATCHASCGECHVIRPSAGGGGLMNGHDFAKTPDMIEVCVTCHKTRGGHAFLGVAQGTQPDVHLTKNNFKCINCHDKNELHGDGHVYDQRYKVAQLPQCTDCHTNVQNANTYHTMHWKTFSCYTCHSQDYNNCGSCHIGGEGARIPSYQGFKIALNPLPDIKNYKYALVRRTLSAPDSWDKFGVPNLDNFSALPTYNYTSPHNIQRWTDRSKVNSGESCYKNCHIRKENGTLVNQNLYLFNGDLLDWEYEASKGITVDGKLPDSWTK